jgi:hypothetical protein
LFGEIAVRYPVAHLERAAEPPAPLVLFPPTA